MASKALMGSLAAILLVAAVVGLVAEVFRTSHGPSPTLTPAADSKVSTTTKSVESICSPTIHQESCKKTLGKALNGSDEVKDIIQAAVVATIEEVMRAFQHSVNLSATIIDPVSQMALNECKRLFNDAMDDLHAVLHVSHNIDGLLTRSDDIKTWLNGVISYQTACIENFADSDLKGSVKKAVASVIELASNALALFKEYSSVSKVLETEFNNITISRHLLAQVNSRAAIQMTPDVVVAQDGTGNFKTITDALNGMPAQYTGRYIIYVKAGVYDEHVVIDVTKTNVYMYGDGPRKTVITGSRNFVDKWTTSESATFVVLGKGFTAKSMGFSNVAGPEKLQAVALRVQGDMAAFFNCRMDAYQDTLYVQSNRQFYRNCVISGTIDFIFGDSFTLIQNCLLILRRPRDNQQNIMTAQGRVDPKEDTAIVIQNCKIVPDKRLFPDRFKVMSYLGRPWKNYAQTVIMESSIGDVITPAGYMEWPGNSLETPFYGEYANTGPGAVTNGRVKWPGVRVLNHLEAQKFIATSLLDNNTWIQYTGGEYFLGLKQ